MKMTIHTDQRAAVRAGIDAPNSTARVEFRPELVADSDILRLVGDHLDFRTGEVTIPGLSSKEALTFTQTPSHEELVAHLRSLMWQWAATDGAPKELKHRYQQAVEATHEVLGARRTRPLGEFAHVRRLEDGTLERWTSGSADVEQAPPVGTAAIDSRAPDWPADPLDAILESEEACAWTAELEAAHQDATLRAFDEAERRLSELEENLKQIRDREALEEAEETERANAERTQEAERLDAERDRLADWIRKNGNPLTQERLKRGWLTHDGLIDAVIRQICSRFAYRPFPYTDSIAYSGRKDNPVDDVEMQAVLDLEADLAAAGMTPVKVEVARTTDTNPVFGAGPGKPRWLRASFDCPALDLRQLVVAFELQRHESGAVEPTAKTDLKAGQ